MKQLIILTFAAAMMASCGNNSGEQSQSETPSSEEQAASSSESSGSDLVKLVINSDDAMKYDRNELRAQAGAKVELTLNHTGEMTKQVMGHNLVILKKGTDIATFAQKAMAAAGNDYIPEGEEVIVHTKLIGGGESTTITFDAPAKGTYDFICTFPGHYALMQGKFIVE